MSTSSGAPVKGATGKRGVLDLRQWLERVEAVGQLKRVSGAERHLEIGAITELNDKKSGPALLFGDVPGYPHDFRILTGAMLNAKTLGMTLGLGTDFTNMELVHALAAKQKEWEERAHQFPAQVVETGPILENQEFGDQIDLTKFPTPIWHEKDGGPFIGTGVAQIHKDPETGWINAGCYRVQLHDKNTVGNYISPGHHGHLIRQKYWAQGKPAPVVMVFGADPLLFLEAASDVPTGVNEMDWIGAIRGQSVPVVMGKVTGLPIPAEAEIAIEGWVYPDKTKTEGPFGEFTGYYASGEKPEPYVEVAALYYRNQPILLGSPPNRPPNDFSYFFSVMRAAAIQETLRKAGIPGIQGVWVHEAGGGRMWITVSLKQAYAGHAKAAAAIAATCQAGGLMARYIISVDEDIDPSNTDDVIWALSTRSDPAADIDILRQCWSNPLDPMLPPEERQHGLQNSRALINACKPFHRLKTFPPVAESSKELLNKTAAKWKDILG